MKQNKKISILAPAKLNLYLEILGRRDDGYHNLESQVVFLQLADKLQFENAREIEILGAKITDNIILKTIQKMQQTFKISSGVRVILEKNIPLAAGLGGGSADAAATIFALSQLWNIEAKKSELYAIAKSIGADVSCCFYYHQQQKNSVEFSGIGDELSEFNAPNNLHFVLVNPQKQLSTASIFGEISEFKKASASEDFYEKRNDLQPVAERIILEITEILSTISQQKNCKLSRMTGSGATCFGVFADENSAKLAVENLKTNFPNYWVQYTSLA